MTRQDCFLTADDVDRLESWFFRRIRRHMVPAGVVVRYAAEPHVASSERLDASETFHSQRYCLVFVSFTDYYGCMRVLLANSFRTTPAISRDTTGSVS